METESRADRARKAEEHVQHPQGARLNSSSYWVRLPFALASRLC